MAQQLPGVQRLIAVASGKGGVGKTTVTVNLALALTARGRRVGIFDADIYGPNVPLLLGLQPTTSTPIDLPVGRVARVPYIQPIERYGMTIMSMGLLLGPSDPVRLDAHFVAALVIQTLHDVMWGERDYVLIDLPPGTGEPQQTLVRAFQLAGAIVVTTPQDLSLVDASRSLGLFQQAQVPLLGLIENMSYFVCPHCGEQVSIFARSDRQWAVDDPALRVLGRIPLHTAFSRAMDSAPVAHPPIPFTDVDVFHTIAINVEHALNEQ